MTSGTGELRPGTVDPARDLFVAITAPTHPGPAPGGPRRRAPPPEGVRPPPPPQHALLPSAGHVRPPRFYLTTAIAYANNAPGLHTVYEVIGADVVARWHRMQGDETRFLTGTDEHSVNIAQSAEAQGKTPREFVDEKVRLFKAAEDALLISPDRFIRTTDPDHYRSAQEMVRRAYDNGDIYLGSYDGWYCPSEGFKAPSDLHETATGMQCPNHPGVPLQWLSERNWFFRLSTYQQRLLDYYEANPDFVQPDYRRNEMLGLHPPGPRGLLHQPRRRDVGHPVPDRRGRPDLAARGRLLGPRGGHDLRLVRRADQLHHRRRLPRRPRGFQHWWPADLHVIGKDIARFHTIYWPAMLWAAGIDAPQHVWVHGWLLVQGGERMSKSRGNFLDPHDVVAAFGAGRRALRDPARGRVRQGHRGQLGLASSAATTRTSRTTSATSSTAPSRWSTATSAASARLPARRGTRRWPRAGRTRCACTARSSTATCLHDALAELWEFVGGANKTVDAEQPWALAKLAKAGDEAARTGCGRSSATSWRRAGWWARRSPRSCPRRRRGSWSSWATPGRTRPTATAAGHCSSSSSGARWPASRARVIETPTPLFPRLEAEAAKRPTPDRRTVAHPNRTEVPRWPRARSPTSSSPRTIRSAPCASTAPSRAGSSARCTACPGYHMFRDRASATAAPSASAARPPSSQLRLYITVDSLEDGCAAAEANGGTVVEPPAGHRRRDGPLRGRPRPGGHRGRALAVPPLPELPDRG